MTLRNTILTISYLFVLGGALNQGVSGVAMSLPFLFIIFILTIDRSYKTNKTFFYISLIMIFLSFISDHGKNKLIYPSIGEEFTATCGWEATIYDDGYAELSPTEPHKNKLNDYDIEITGYQRATIDKYKIPCGEKWILKKVVLTHPDFSTRQNPLFQIGDKELLVFYGDFDKLLERGELSHPDINSSDDLQSFWTVTVSSLMYWPVIPIVLSSIFKN